LSDATDRGNTTAKNRCNTDENTSGETMLTAEKRFASALITCLGLILLFAPPCRANMLRGFHSGDTMPSFSLPVLTTGKEFHFTPAATRPTAIFFFSINPKFRRGRALALLSELAALFGRYRGRADILAIYEDDKGAETVKNFLRSLPVKPQVLIDHDHEVYDRYGVFMTPIVIILAPGGRLHEVIPYTYEIKRIIEANMRFLLGDIDREELKKILAPPENKTLSPEEREFVRRINYARVLENKKLFEQALREFQKAVKLAPERPEGYVGMGFMEMELKKYGDAADNFKKARKIDPESDSAIAGLGLVLYRQGDTAKALPHLENAFISPEPRIEVMLALAEIYEDRGEMDKAIRMNKLVVQRLLTMLNQRWQ